MSTSDERPTDADGRVPNLAVWAVAALGALAGLALALGGLVLLGLADRETIEDMVRSGEIETAGVTDAEAVDLVASLAWWSAWGLVATGLLFVLAAVGLVLYQRRLGRRRDAAGLAAATIWSHALLGAFVTLLTTFLPASPLLGGGVAGYLRGGGGNGARAGGLAGILAAVPTVVLLGAVGLGVVLGMPDLGAAGGPLTFGAILALATLFVAVVVVALSAAGGFLGAVVAGDR